VYSSQLHLRQRKSNLTSLHEYRAPTIMMQYHTSLKLLADNFVFLLFH
jgi:hypothetical protein